ncbi:hypothetical protein [Microbulbifer magnicolonia]|uniref:hypothetical protein n=1 Tax=Microbulbifer magnicolonia TaxID=3109744 RepID=UPI002B411363|nr:hypothetical protein [Microbulbifer sp. GG15]
MGTAARHTAARPVALIYQGSFFEVEFSREKNAPFGGYWEARTIKALLDAGYAVIAPRAPVELPGSPIPPVRPPSTKSLPTTPF